MMTIEEALKLLNELADENEKAEIITINAFVESLDVNEDLPSGNPNDKYDEQTLEDWYDFAANVEGIIDNFCEIVDISTSANVDSLSEYISFYSYDQFGNKKNYIINLRLSDHGTTTKARELRKKRVKKINSNYILKSVIVNKRQFKTYNDAIDYIRKILVKEFI